MRVIDYISLRDFEAWSGGKDTTDELTSEQLDIVEENLDEICGGEGMTSTEINDFLWFERDTIAEWLGFADFDELMKSNSDES